MNLTKNKISKLLKCYNQTYKKNTNKKELTKYKKSFRNKEKKNNKKLNNNLRFQSIKFKKYKKNKENIKNKKGGNSYEDNHNVFNQYGLKVDDIYGLAQSSKSLGVNYTNDARINSLYSLEREVENSTFDIDKNEIYNSNNLFSYIFPDNNIGSSKKLSIKMNFDKKCDENDEPIHAVKIENDTQQNLEGLVFSINKDANNSKFKKFPYQKGHCNEISDNNKNINFDEEYFPPVPPFINDLEFSNYKL